MAADENRLRRIEAQIVGLETSLNRISLVRGIEPLGNFSSGSCTNNCTAACTIGCTSGCTSGCVADPSTFGVDPSAQLPADQEGVAAFERLKGGD